MSTAKHIAGFRVGNYKLHTLLGVGQTGEVWVAVGPDKEPIALKFFPQEAELQARGEYERACLFSHRNLLRPLSFHEEKGMPYMVMPYCEGRSMDNLAGHFVDEKTCWKLLLDISSALSALQEKGFCHGDVKPSNILWDGEVFVLADFGSCSQVGRAPVSEDRSSYSYAAPEKTATEKSDVWSLAASVFNLIMGSQVFNGLGGHGQHRCSPIPHLPKSKPVVLARLLVQCLSFDPSQRPTVSQIREWAEEQYANCLSRLPERPVKKSHKEQPDDPFSHFWPDPMIEPL